MIGGGVDETQAHPAIWALRARSWCTEGRAVSGFLVVTVLIALVVIGLLVWVWVRDRRGTPGRRTMGADQARTHEIGNEIMGPHGFRKRSDGRPR
jgi:hypothetical protein